MPKRCKLHKCEICDNLTKNKLFCSVKCYYIGNNIKQKIQINCLNCNKPTFNPKFCSKTCAAKYNNAKNPKRKKRAWHCEKCGKIKEKPYYGAHRCLECASEIRALKYRSVGELRKACTKRGQHRQNIHTHIREQARRIYAKNNCPKFCAVCGYDKHIEICHRKPVSEYGDDALISDINSLDNLIGLCPNCHWEYDKGLLNF